MLSQLDVFADDELRSAAMNMAIDEALLQCSSSPALRFYKWRRPSVSFGYFGTFAAVAEEHGDRELVRRWTGGGTVLHGDDLTYSITLSAAVAAQFRSSRAVYTAVHEAIRRALTSPAGATLATAAAPKISDACFANAVQADVIVDGRKIAGAAQRRSWTGLLHQGSIQYDALPADFRERFARQLCGALQWKTFWPDLLARAQQIAEHRYATDAWLRLR